MRPLMTQPDPPSPASMFENRLRKNLALRLKWAKRKQVSCYRVYERDIPEVPLTVDRYEDRVCVSERSRPNTDAMSDEAHDAWRAAMTQAVCAVMSVEPEAVYWKERERQRGATQYARRDRSDDRFVVTEGGREFFVNLKDYLDTGLFLDHRPLRGHVGETSAGKRFLNLFCYTGAFTVYAATGGASSSTSVDLNPNYLGWARDNLELNRQDISKHRLVQGDVLSFLSSFDRRTEAPYDLVMVDPPTFSNSKRTPNVFDVQRDHLELLGRVFDRLAPKGVVYFSTNFRPFRFETAALMRRCGPVVLEELSAWTVPEDFRDRRIHRAWRLTRKEPA